MVSVFGFICQMGGALEANPL